ncbi:hypothetical protein BpHYR1_009114 [Brachionus plicatilis]|uniref:Uncharacterized protein n=1 Tax=Brachionus plicatilis TaxID=10195 RepID=A0A3M7SFM2_BRAPC|nr:hypothetical protein BpHYR1_009114 [Brachionus plicatilis]
MYSCVHYRKPRNRQTQGTRINQKNFDLKHNHTIGEDIFKIYPKNRRLNYEQQYNLNNFDTSGGNRIKALIETIKNDDKNNKISFVLGDENQLEALFIQTSSQLKWFTNFRTFVHLDRTFKYRIAIVEDDQWHTTGCDAKQQRI